jgi:malate dehydrogenase (oxaloacetate-decarboxylating)(NADP+)
MPQSKHDLTGPALLNDARHNKSTAFTKEERERFGLRGLLPAAVCGQDTQLERVLENIRRKEHDIEKYIALRALEGRNERLFYRALIDHTEELLPLVYTPTVGQACREFAHIFRQSRGLYITPEDRGSVRELLDNWPEHDVRVIVVTDGERILGLGDLGANGMGIPIGKLSLYTAFAGIDPSQCLPVQLDVGTNNRELRDDPLYLGWTHERVEGDAYDALVEEFVNAVQDAYPKALIQFEDFLTPNAYRLLHRYRDQVLCFNDDIQGTAAVSLAGVYASTRISGTRFEDLRVMFLGAGSAATGIGDLMTRALVDAGLSSEEARRRLWFVDVKGLVVQGRDDLMPHNLPYAHAHNHGRYQRPTRDLRTVEPDIASRMHSGSGVSLERGSRRLREREPFSRRGTGRGSHPASSARQQRLCVPRNRTGRDRMWGSARHRRDVLSGSSCACRRGVGRGPR